MREQDEELGALVLEKPETHLLRGTLTDTYQANCSCWQLASIRTGQRSSMLSTHIYSIYSCIVCSEWLCVGGRERLG